jgi:hypothetical protein
MKKSLLRAAVVACLPYCAMGLAVAMIPAQAADKDKDKAEAPKVSKSVSKFLSECKKGLDAKDWKTAVDQCTQAQAVPDTTDYDKYLINRFIGVAYLNLNDHAKAEDAFVAVVKNPATPVEDRNMLLPPAMSLASEANNHALVIELGQIALKADLKNPDILNALAGSYYQTNDSANALTYAQKGIEAAAATGKIAPYGLYQIIAFTYDKAKDRANEVKAFEAMARDYGKADDWRYLLDFSLEQLPAGNKGAREIAALDLYRLRLIANGSWISQNFLEAEDAAHSIRSWGDSRTFLQLGVSQGTINGAKVAPLMNQINSDAKKDEPILATVEKSAKNSKDVANVAEAYYGYARYADAARTAQKAIDMGGPAAGEAKLVLALSQIKQGNEAAATQTLANFQGDPALARAAALINIYLTRKYGKTAAAQ